MQWLKNMLGGNFRSQTAIDVEALQEELDQQVLSFKAYKSEGLGGVLKYMRDYAELADNVHVDPRITTVLRTLRDADYMTEHPITDDGSASFVALHGIRQAISQMQKLGGTANPVMLNIVMSDYSNRKETRAYSKFDA